MTLALGIMLMLFSLRWQLEYDGAAWLIASIVALLVGFIFIASWAESTYRYVKSSAVAKRPDIEAGKRFVDDHDRAWVVAQIVTHFGKGAEVILVDAETYDRDRRI